MFIVQAKTYTSYRSWNITWWDGLSKGRKQSHISRNCEYVKERLSLHITNLYRAQPKRACQIIGRTHYHVRGAKAKVPQATPEKNEALIDALKYF